MMMTHSGSCASLGAGQARGGQHKLGQIYGRLPGENESIQWACERRPVVLHPVDQLLCHEMHTMPKLVDRLHIEQQACFAATFK